MLNQTSTVAVVGVGGGALVGAGVGAIAGANTDHILNCDNGNDRDALKKEIDEANLNADFAAFGVNLQRGAEMSKAQCASVVALQNRVSEIERNDCYVGFGNCGGKTEQFRRLTSGGAGITCSGGGVDCLDYNAFYNQVESLKSLLGKVTSLQEVEGGRAGRGALIGGAAGAAAGGVATAITAFVERNNITCHIGDGLDTIAFGKSGKIDSLKDFYVKWDLKLPDTILPTAQVVDCQSWKTACGTLKDINECAAAQVNYRAVGASRTILVDGACTASGSVCIENYPVAVSNGACQ